MEAKELFYKHCDKKTLPKEFLGERFVEINLMDIYEFEKAIEELLKEDAKKYPEENNPLDLLVIPKIADIKKQIQYNSFVANDVWNCTDKKRIYQDETVPVIELKKVLEIIDSNFSE